MSRHRLWLPELSQRVPTSVVLSMYREFLLRRVFRARAAERSVSRCAIVEKNRRQIWPIFYEPLLGVSTLTSTMAVSTKGITADAGVAHFLAQCWPAQT